jgi:hypothetical protein
MMPDRTKIDAKVRISIYVLAFAIIIVLVIADKPFYGLLNTGTLTVIAVGVTVIIQDARGLISSYHLSLAHHITLVMLPPILSMAAKAVRPLKAPPLPSPPPPLPHSLLPLPWSTICTASLGFCIIFAMMGMAGLNPNRCSFDGHYMMGPQTLNPVVWIALVAFCLSWPTLLVLSLNKRFRQSRTKWTPVILTICHLSAVAASVGLIYFIEWNVEFAKAYLQGGSENAWGFGQILAVVTLMIPLLELTQHTFSRSEWDLRERKRRRFKYWLDESFMPIVANQWNGKSSSLYKVC